MVEKKMQGAGGSTTPEGDLPRAGSHGQGGLAPPSAGCLANLTGEDAQACHCPFSL